MRQDKVGAERLVASVAAASSGHSGRPDGAGPVGAEGELAAPLPANGVTESKAEPILQGTIRTCCHLYPTRPTVRALQNGNAFMHFPNLHTIPANHAVLSCSPFMQSRVAFLRWHV